MFSFSGIVSEGKGEATMLGFPTLNIPLTVRNVSGIYAAEVEMEGKKYNAAAFADTKRKILEAHILGSAVDGRGKHITITLLQKIRDRRKFKTEVELRKAIAKDIEEIEAFFRTA